MEAKRLGKASALILSWKLGKRSRNNIKFKLQAEINDLPIKYYLYALAGE